MKEYDVAVAGLGTAGAVALICAAKLKLSVIGIERLYGMGGVGTLGAIGGYYMGSKGGAYEKINEAAYQYSVFTSKDYVNTCAKLYELEKEAREAGARIEYNTVVFDVLKTDNHVKGLKLLSNGQIYEIRAKCVIDCTGDAHVLKMAGCETQLGRSFDKAVQPFTNSMVQIKDNLAVFSNTDAGYVNQYDAENYSNSVLKSIAAADTKTMRDIITNGAILGVREGATLLGEENITLQGLFSNQQPDKVLFHAYANIDHHGKDTAFEDFLLKDWYLPAGLWGLCFSVPVPMGALIPRGYKGILAGGRHLAVDHNLSSLIRMKRDMEKCGEAAAYLAYLSVENGVDAKDVNYNELLDMLKETNCSAYEMPLYSSPNLELSVWPDTPDKVRSQIENDNTGIGIWGALLLGDVMVSHLESWMAENTEISKYAAIALGLMNQKSGLPLLREMAKNKDMTLPQTNMEYVYTLGNTAIYLLGRLGDLESIGILFDIIKERGAFDETLFIQNKLYTTVNDMRFQLFSFAVASLMDIRSAQPDTHFEIDRFMDKYILDCDETMMITLKETNDVFVDMFAKIKEYIIWRR